MVINETETKRLLEEIFGRLNLRHHKEHIKEEPETYLLALLTVINREEEERPYTTLHWAVQKAAFDNNLEEAREKLKQPV